MAQGHVLSSPPPGDLHSTPGRAASIRPVAVGPFRWLMCWLLGTLTLWFLLYRDDRDIEVLATVVVSGAGLVAVWAGQRWGRHRIGPRLAASLGALPSGSSPRATIGVLLLYWLGVFYFMFEMASNAYVLAFSRLDVSQALANPSLAYAGRQLALSSPLGTPGFAWIHHIGYVFLFVLPALLMLWWSRLGRLTRLVGFLAIVGYGLSWTAMGTLKGLVETAVLLAAPLAVAAARSRPAREDVPREGRAFVPLAVLVLVGAALGAAFLAATTLGARLIEAPQADRHVVPPAALVEVLGEQAAYGANGFVGYFTQGHSGLGASLSQPFVWTQGSGSSEAIQSIAPFLTSDELAHQAYPYRAQTYQGWSAKGKWQTVYPWLASDVTFMGAVGFVGLAALLGAIAWSVAVRRGGVLSTAIFTQAFLFLIYIPLNNGQISSTSNVVAIFILWSCAIGYRLNLLRAPRKAKSATPSDSCRGRESITS